LKKDWKTQYYILYGRCFSFNVPEWLKKLVVIEMKVTLKMNSFLFLHHPRQFDNVDSNSKIPGIVGKALFIEVTHDVCNRSETISIIDYYIFFNYII
jgi:hypothetical protein